MHRESIQQFRTTLASRTDQGALVSAYRELARRPEVASGMAFGEWAAWPTVSTPVARA
jgi:hypothetical protein